MWVCQLPLAEQTICIGWLLYSAPEYNLNILRRQIKQDTGIDMALRFHSISDDGSGQANCTTPRTKALHLEVDSHTSPSQLNCIERLYSAAAKTFPAGIKMRLVPARRLEINKAHVTKVGQLISLQARFLKFTETCWIGEVGSKVITQKRSLYDTLRAMTLPPGLAAQPGKPLFHAISPTATNDGYLVRYLPKYRVPAQAAIDRLSPSPTTTLATLASTPLLSNDRNLPEPGTPPCSPGHMEAIEMWIKARFCTPFSPGSQPAPYLPSFIALSIPSRPAPNPSHYKLLPWLEALRQQLQNTAWDRWRYRNGVQ